MSSLLSGDERDNRPLTTYKFALLLTNSPPPPRAVSFTLSEALLVEQNLSDPARQVTNQRQRRLINAEIVI